ncbi:GntR family transcriptional regulator [Nocardiopsis composta]|uniref:GntR family transcriptional regulator n=1 Tax=Nocardiopsis composta TaxID=157465 RepID=A0A7W8VFV2_9ACTN|nr:GntR family transcriptional regulator [Nocardiopsis composta]MBB5434513.1 GntR family transcriptional regulator [Nocardiopsis composta]
MEPRHLEIAHDLMEDIDEGRYPPGAALPTEDKLMGRYGTSRNTVRRALQELTSRGRIDVKQGSGSTVRSYAPVTHLAGGSADGEDDEHYASYVERVEAERDAEPHQRLRVMVEAAGDAVAELLGLGAGDDRSVVIRRCDRYLNGRLWQRQMAYYPRFLTLENPKGAELVGPEDIQGGVRALLEEMGYPQTGSWDVIGARMPSLKESTLFSVGPGVPLMVHDRLAYSGDRPLRLIRTLMPADRHQLLYREGELSPEALRTGMGVNVHDR